MKVRPNMDLLTPSEMEAYLKVAEIIREEFGMSIIEIQNNKSVRAGDKYDELVLKFVKE